MATIGEKRAEANSLRRRSQKKASRLSTHNNVDWDHRSNQKYASQAKLNVTSDDIQHMNSRQLTKYIDAQKNFLSRSTQFHGDAHGRILSPEKVKQYKHLENSFMNRAKRVFNMFADMPSFSQPEKTVEQVWQDRTPGGGSLSSSGTQNPMQMSHRKIGNIQNEESLDELIADKMEQLEASFYHNEIDDFKKEMSHIFDIFGEGFNDIKEEFLSLNDDQMMYLISTPDFADNMSEQYAIAKDKTEEQIQNSDLNEIMRGEKGVHENVQYAKKIKNLPKASTVKARRRK